MKEQFLMRHDVPKRMKMNDWRMPICGLKPAGTGRKIMLRSFATHNQLPSGGGLQPNAA
jgi:hypothetical protein